MIIRGLVLQLVKYRKHFKGMSFSLLLSVPILKLSKNIAKVKGKYLAGAHFVLNSICIRVQGNNSDNLEKGWGRILYIYTHKKYSLIHKNIYA